MRWLNIALNLPLALGLAVAAHADSAADVQQGTSSAATSGATMKSYTGTGTALSNNLILPLTQASPLTTADGQTQFVTNGLQASGNPLIQITLTPDPATGDLRNIIIQQDLTATGTLGYTQIFPLSGDGAGQKISGVCQNGYIQCNNNFTNCQYRTWQTAASGAITAVTANGNPGSSGSVSGLAGCYCFNNFCTGQNNTLIELGAISSDVGGGVLSSFLSANTGMTISSALSSNNASGSLVLSYYGYRPTAITMGSTTSMTPAQIAAMPVIPAADTQTPQTFYNDSANLNNAAQNALTAQKNAPTSLYNIVTNTANSQAGSNVACQNNRSIAITATDRDYSFSTNKILHGIWSDMGVKMVQNSPGTYQFTGNETGESLFSVSLPPGVSSTTISGATTVSAGPTNVLDINPQSADININWANYTTNVGNTSVACDSTTSNILWLNSVGPSMSTSGSCISTYHYTCGPTFSACSAQKNHDFPNIDMSVLFHYQTQDQTDTAFNGCAAIESNTSCTLQQDVWDGRPVMVNGLQMNNRQLGQTCNTYPGPLRAVTVCKPWFVQNRTYYCSSSATPYDFSQARSNAATIDNSTTMPTNASMRYIDPTQGGATLTYGTSVAEPLPGCPQMCETKTPFSQTGVLYSNSPQSVSQTTSAQTATQYLFYYKECVETAGTWTCPIDLTRGDVVVTQCGCSSDMSNALGALQVAGSSAENAICSAH